MSKNEKRTDIIKASLELFAKYGYNNTTTKLIAQMANVNEITIFRNFGTKKELFNVVVKEYVDRLQMKDTIISKKNLPPDEVIRQAGRDYINYNYKNKLVFKIQMKMQDEIEDSDKLKFSISYSQDLQKYFEYLKEKDILLGDAKLLAQSFVASILGTFTFDEMSKSLGYERVIEIVNQQIETFINANIKLN